MRRNTSLSDRAHLILFLFYFEFASFHFDAEQQRELAATLRARAKYYLFGVVSCKYWLIPLNRFRSNLVILFKKAA